MASSTQQLLPQLSPLYQLENPELRESRGSSRAAQAGAPVGVILANLAFIITSSLVSEESFYSWGWRIPFLASAVLIAISMYIQLNLEDTKAFKELEALRQSQKDGNEKIIKRSPILEAIRKYPSRIALAAGAFLSQSHVVAFLFVLCSCSCVDPCTLQSVETMLVRLVETYPDSINDSMVDEHDTGGSPRQRG